MSIGPIDAGVMISSGNTGGVPSGEISKLYTQMVGGQEAFGQNITTIPGGYSFASKDGKRAEQVTLQKLYVVLWEGTQVTLATHGNLTFTNNTYPTKDVITRASGSWETDGVQEGDIIKITGSVNNNGSWKVDSVSGATATLIVEDSLTTEGAVAATATCWHNEPRNYTEAFNYHEAFFRDHHELGQPPIYLWVKNLTDNKYIELGRTPAGAQLNYLEGYITSYSWIIGEGNIYIFNSLTFKECID